MRIINPILFLLLSVLILHAAPANEIEAVAQFSPAKIYIDQSTTYEVVIKGVGRMGNISVPQVDGLVFYSESKSTNMSFGFGRGNTLSTHLRFGIKAQRPGEYTIPSFQVRTNDGLLEIPATTLQVLPQSPVRQQQLNEQKRQEAEAQRQLIGLQVSIGEEPMYVGQAIPLHLIAYSRADLYAVPTSLPEKNW